MAGDDKVNILLVDDQPAKLLSYEVILSELGENLIKASSATEALQHLLKSEIAVVLVDVCMPELDGFELAGMIRDHPRFQRTAIIFISAIHLEDVDRLRGYAMGAVDYVPVPVIPEVLRAKVRIFAELYRKTRQLERLNRELEQRVAERTAALEASTARLLASEQRRSLALAAGRMGSWDIDLRDGSCAWDDGQSLIFGLEPQGFAPTLEAARSLVDTNDWARLETALAAATPAAATYQTELRVIRPDRERRWCIVSCAASFDRRGKAVRISGVTLDITDRKKAEEQQQLLAAEVDHRARNTLAVVQAIVRLTRSPTVQAYTAAVEGRIQALSASHTLLSKSRWKGAEVAQLVEAELAPYRAGASATFSGPAITLPPDKAQALALSVHELATNAAKYGALSRDSGAVDVRWAVEPGRVVLEWTERGGPRVEPPTTFGFGTKIINATMKQQIGGQVSFDWRPDGLHCVLTLPAGTEALATAAGDSNLVQLSSAKAKTLLLVEDEVLVGMMMRDLLTDLGYFVSGPVATLAEALEAAHTQTFDGAILDVNLCGELVYPLAELLMARQLPFIFVTGYDQATVGERFAKIPVLRKPIGHEALERAVRTNLGQPSAPPAARVGAGAGAA